MRLAVMADIHGNLPALEAVLDDLRPFAVDGVIVAGDIIGGPFVVETIERIRSLNGWVILGNNEEYFRKYRDGAAPEAWRVSRQWLPLRWVYAQLTEEARDYVLSFIAEAETKKAVQARHEADQKLRVQETLMSMMLKIDSSTIIGEKQKLNLKTSLPYMTDEQMANVLEMLGFNEKSHAQQ